MLLCIFVIVKTCIIFIYMEIYQLRHLVAFSECGNLSKAAEAVFTSQPALSRSMKNLETEIGVSLFNRTKNSISLNEFGMLAAQKAKIVLDAHDEMLKDVREAEKRKRTFSYGSIAPAPIWELTPIVSQLFIGRIVNSELKDSEDDLMKGLDEGDYNMVITLRPFDDEHDGAVKYFSRPFISEHLFVLLPQNHHLAQRRSIKLRDLAHEKILIHKKIGFWYEVCRDNIPDAIFLEQEDLSILREIASATELPSFVTNITEKTLNQAPQGKVVVPISDKEVNVQFYCVCKAENARDYAAIFEMVKKSG